MNILPLKVASEYFENSRISDDCFLVYSKVLENFSGFRRFLVSREKMLFSLRESFFGKGLFLPSLLGNGSASLCLSSYCHLSRFNLLLFKDVDDGEFFYVIQTGHGCSGFYFPCYDLLIAGNSVIKIFKSQTFAEDFKKKVLDHFESCKHKSSAKLAGFVDFHKRPYHYFYDKLPFLIYLNQNIPQVPIFSLSSSFYPSNSASSCLSLDDVNASSVNDDVFFFHPGKVPAFSYFESSSLIVERFSQAEDVAVLKKTKSKTVFLWIGVCQEKRAWGGKVEVIVDFIKYACGLFEDVVFIFDGLTCPTFENADCFREVFCDKDVQVLKEVLGRVGEVKYFDFIGRKSREKIVVSQLVDFYFSSALTDSMWPAHFGYSKGISYAANVANTNLHHHPLSYIVPGQYIVDADDDESNWARKGYEIDKDAIRFFLRSGLDFTKSMSEKLFKFGVFDYAACEPYVKPDSFSQFTGRLSVNASMPLTIPLYGRGEGFLKESLFCVSCYRYCFLASYFTGSGLNAVFFIVFYSSSGEVMGKVDVDSGSPCYYLPGEGVIYYRPFIEVHGEGDLFFKGFYAQACFDKEM